MASGLGRRFWDFSVLFRLFFIIITPAIHNFLHFYCKYCVCKGKLLTLLQCLGFYQHLQCNPWHFRANLPVCLHYCPFKTIRIYLYKVKQIFLHSFLVRVYCYIVSLLMVYVFHNKFIWYNYNFAILHMYKTNCYYISLAFCQLPSVPPDWPFFCSAFSVIKLVSCVSDILTMHSIGILFYCI